MKMMRGGETVGKSLSSMLGTLVDGINPIGGNTFLNFAAPTIIDPIVDLYTNTDFAGNPIFPEANPFGIDKRDSIRYFNNTSPIYTSISGMLANLPFIGGEGDYINGWIEVNPNAMGYMIEWITGGSGTFVRRVIDMGNSFSEQGSLPQRIANGDDWSTNDIPILRRFVNVASGREDMQYYVDNRDKILRIDRSLKKAIEEKDRPLIESLRDQYPDELQSVRVIKKIEQKRRKISEAIEQIRDNDQLTLGEKRAAIAELKRRQNELIRSANQFFTEL
jgi:hypothetical protein